MTSIASHDSVHSVLSELQSPKEYVPISDNLVDKIWNSDGRPAVPNSEVVVQPIEFSGVTVEKKLLDVRDKMKKEGVHGVVLSVSTDG